MCELEPREITINLQRNQIWHGVGKCFFEKIHNFRDDSLPITQEIFDVLSLIPNLQNLLIGNIAQFNETQLRIKNKNIRNLTIGDYLQDKTVNMPFNLMKEIHSSISNLSTLNLFSITFIMIQISNLYQFHLQLMSFKDMLT